MNKYILILSFFVFSLLTSCEKKPVVVKIDEKLLLAHALKIKDINTVNNLKSKIRLTENSQNIIDLYMKLSSENLLQLIHSIDYLQQFYSDMKTVHQSMFDQMAIWVYMKQVYRQEISPPVRILQRQELFLAPSKIDFSACSSENSNCAHEQRKQLLVFMSENEINSRLRRMALRDPCVNLSSHLQNQQIANRCLLKSSGDLKIELLPIPRFTNYEWLQTINDQ